MPCPRFPSGKLQTIIEKTVATGKEHGFVSCADGSKSEIVSGGESQMDIGEAVQSCDLSEGPVDIVHTHPNGVDDLSDMDRKVAAHDDVDSVCVAVEDGTVYCEMVNDCEREVET